MSRPNIFKYANKELSQDAMVCWLLECLKCTEEKYRKIGENFIKLIFNEEIENGEIQEDDDIEIELTSPHKQYFKMDVYAVVRIKDKLYPIIFEDKTNTYLHSGQLERYCEQVVDWMNEKSTKNKKSYFDKLQADYQGNITGWGKVKYVYYKIGYPFGWQKIDFENKKKNMKADISFCEIYIDEMIEFLGKQPEEDMLLDNYREALEEQKKGIGDKNNVLADMKECTKLLFDKDYSNQAVVDWLFQECFGPNVKFDYNHQRWAAKCLFNTRKSGGNSIAYGFRFDTRKNPKTKKQES